MNRIIVILMVLAGMCFAQDNSWIGLTLTGVAEDSNLFCSYKKWGFTDKPAIPVFIFSPDTSNKGYTIVGKDTILSNAPYSAMVVLTIIQYYELYEKECYADSSIQEDNFELKYIDNRILRLPIKRMVHREPDFAGFIEFLRREAKKR